jgi:hypothetical protein
MKNLARWVRVGRSPCWLAGRCCQSGASSLAYYPSPPPTPPKKAPQKRKKKRREIHLLLIKEKWNSSKILYSLLSYIFASTYNFVELFIYLFLVAYLIPKKKKT